MGVLLFTQLPREAGSKFLMSPARWYDYGIDLRSFPRDAAEWMQDGEWPGPMYNDYVWGGYLIYRLSPKRRVFVDGRAEVYYATHAFDDEMTIHYGSPGWEQALDKRNVEVILTARNGRLAQLLTNNPRWRLAFTGSVEVVYTRHKDPPPGELPPPLRMGRP
jgi:hypothetical protein